MPAGAWTIYNEFKLTEGKKIIDLINDAFKVALFTSLSNCGDPTLTNAWYATLNNELTTANGYTVGGVAVTPSWTGDHSLSAKTWSITNPSWAASGSGITARYAVIYDNTTANKDLVAFCLLDNTPADVFTPAGLTLTITISVTPPGAGVFTQA